MATVKEFFDHATNTLTYVVFDEVSGDAVIIDPVLDYDPLASATSTASARTVLAYVQEHGLSVHWILETHAHADHLSGAPILKKRLGAKVAVGAQITRVQETFKHIFHLPDLATDGRQFDKLIDDGEVLHAGTLRVQAIATPGHTPACMSYLVDDAVFTGDALFMPDFGTGRCDFPQGSAEALYRSVHDKLYALPDETRVFVGHDYQPDGRPLRWETTIGESKRSNKQLREATSQAEFVAFRQARDAKLSPPRLIFQSVQVNIDAGEIPNRHENGVRYLRLPLNVFGAPDDLDATL